jgi:phage terminase large subunit GpA-like protein
VLQPPEAISVAEAAEKYVNIDLGGSWAQFDNSTAPYMVEPMNMTQSRSHRGVAFVSSAQGGKTAGLILNVAAYHIRVTGMDFMIVCPSGGAATDFAVRRVDRMIANSPKLKDQLLQVRNSDNQKRKQFKNGALGTIAHPSKNELSGKPIGCVLETDYDRMEDDIDGEGNAFDLGSKRTQTFLSLAMTVAESTPSRPVQNPKKILEEHEAPDCTGILALYNSGDRRKWYWPCPQCDEYFTPSWELMRWDSTLVGHKQQGETASMECPHCGYPVQPSERHGMQQWGYWKPAAGRVTSIASFWLDGTAAAFTTWPELVERYLDAKKKFDDTGDESSLLKFYNTDLGRPYVPHAQEAAITPEAMMARAEPTVERPGEVPKLMLDDPPEVPADVRALIPTCDVQKGHWVVQVHGIRPGRPWDIVIVDRYSIVMSKRLDEDGHPYGVRPHQHQEDWEQLVENVILRSYPLSDGSGRVMQAKLTVCDAGGFSDNTDYRTSGSGGVSEKAFGFQRDMQRRGLAGRFHLVRGSGTRTDKLTWIDKPQAQNKSNGPTSWVRGDVPVLYMKANEVKDILANRLEVVEPGAGRVAFPDWLPAWWFGELCAEYYDPGKGWKNPKGRRNEAWDCLYYAIGVGLSPLLGLDRVSWDKPPPWLAPWDENPFVLEPALPGEVAPVAMVSAPRKTFDFVALGAQMG